MVERTRTLRVISTDMLADIIIGLVLCFLLPVLLAGLCRQFEYILTCTMVDPYSAVEVAVEVHLESVHTVTFALLTICSEPTTTKHRNNAPRLSVHHEQYQRNEFSSILFICTFSVIELPFLRGSTYAILSRSSWPPELATSRAIAADKPAREGETRAR